MSADNDIIMSIPSDSALRQAEILVLQRLSDGLSAVTRTVDKMGNKLDRVHDDVLAMKTIKLDEALKDLQHEFDGYKEKADSERAQLRLDITKLQTTIIPLSVVFSALLTGGIGLIVQRILH